MIQHSTPEPHDDDAAAAELNAFEVAAASANGNILAAELRTDAANGRRLANARRPDIRYVRAWDKWLVWDGRRWRIDDPTLEGWAKDEAEKQWDFIDRYAVRHPTDKQTVAAMKAFAKSSNSAAGIRNAIWLAHSEPLIAIDHDALDQQPWLLNVANGTLDLRTERLHDHCRDDLLTKLTPVEYDPADRKPETWLRFLDEVFEGNQRLIDYVQRAIGYSLTGRTNERCLFFLLGTGRNGKSTLVTTLQKLLGEYACQVTTEMLMVGAGDRHPTEICDLHGRRLAVACETEDGRRLAESLVKQMTGGEDVMKARRMREDFWEFRSTHKLWLTGNYRPRIRGTDDGIWDRMRLIEFGKRFEQPDKELAAKLEEELTGILGWAVEGCVAWQDVGLEPPPEVVAATRGYRAEQDTIRQFVDERCIVGEAFEDSASMLYATFRLWSADRGDREFANATAFGRRLDDMGFPFKLNARGKKVRPVIRVGLRRRMTDDEEAAE